MAQIRKFNDGGGITIGTRKYSYDEINEYLDSIGADPQSRAALAGIVDQAINLDGKNITYNPNSNTLAGPDVSKYLVDYFGSERRTAKNNAGRSRRWTNRQATRNSDFHIYNSAVALFSGMPGYFKKKEDDAKAEAKANNKLPRITDPDGFYSTVDGKTVYADSTSNRLSEQVYRSVWSLLENGNFDDYNLELWNNDKTLNGLVPWYGTLTNDEKAHFSPDAIIARMRTGEAPSVEDMDVWSRMGALFGDSVEAGSAQSGYTPADSTPETRDLAKAYGVSFERVDGRDKLVDASGNYYHMMAHGIPFLAGTIYKDGYVGKDGTLYTKEEIEQGETGPVGTVLNAFYAPSDSWTDTSDFGQSIEAWRNAVLGDGLRTYLNFHDKSNFAHVFYNPDEYGIDGIWNHTGLTGPMYVRDDTQYYSSTNPNVRVINYLSKGYTDGFPNSKFRVMWKDQSGNTVYKDYDDEATMIADGIVSPKTFKRTPAPSQITMSAWETATDGNRYRTYPKTFKNDVVMVDASGKFYYKNDRGDGQFAVTPVSNTKRLMDILNHPEKYERYSNIENALGSDVPMSKHGGTIAKIRPLPKFVTGGPIRSSTASTRTSEGAETSVTQTHSAARSGNLGKDLKDAWEYDFTDAEKWQIRGAITDLAGVALSFIPGAHYVAAATGVGGTAMTFWGDVKKDGFQLRDLGSGLLSLAMDVGTVFTGGVAKTAKVIKAVKAAAKPIMKLFAAFGVAHGAQAIAKIARGESVSSQDLVDILRGISSTAIGSKMLKNQIGDAKLSKRLETEVLKTQNAKIKTKPTTEIEGVKVEADAAKINGKTKADVEAYLKGEVKTKLEEKGIAFDEAKHGQDLSRQFGIEYDKGEFDGLKWRNLFKGKGFVQRAEGTARYSSEEPESGKWLLTHFLWPGTRMKNLGFDWGYWQRSGRLGSITPEALTAAQTRLSTKGLNDKLEPFDEKYRLFDRWADQSLLQQTMLNPKGFGFDIDADPTKVAFSWGRPVYGRVPKPASIGDPMSPYQRYGVDHVAGGRNNMFRPSHIEEPESADVLRRRAAIQKHKVIKSTPRMIGAPSNEELMRFRHQSRIQAAEARHQLPENGTINLGPTQLTVRPSAYMSVTDGPVRVNGISVVDGPVRVNGASGSVPFNQAELANIRSMVTTYAKIGGSPNDVYSYVARALVAKGYKPTSAMVEAVVNAARYAGYLKNGGRIQFAKRGTKVVKCQTPNGDGVPEGEGGAEKDPQMPELVGVPHVDKNGVKYRQDKNGVTYVVNDDGTVKLDDDGLPMFYALEDLTPSEVVGSANRYGNAVGDPRVGLDPLNTKFLGKVGQALGNLAVSVGGLNRQRQNVDKIRPASYVSQSEHHTPYRTPGTKIFDTEILRLRSKLMNPASADWYQNLVTRLTNSEQERNVAGQKIEYLSKMDNMNAEKSTASDRYYSDNRAKTANLMAKEAQQLDTTKAAYQSKYVGDMIKNVQLAGKDLSSIMGENRAAQNTMSRLDFSWEYEDWLKDLKDKYNADKTKWEGLNPGKTYMSQEDYIKKNPALKNQYRSFMRRNIMLSKKGSKLRPLREQLEIDSAKSRDKELAQLSKQAHDLLKTLLS